LKPNAATVVLLLNKLKTRQNSNTSDTENTINIQQDQEPTNTVTRHRV